MARSEDLGTARTVDLPSGRIAYRERGAGPAVVFVHGLLVNADLWRLVVPAVAEAGYRCVSPDWPLGSHRDPLPPNADLSPPGVARLIAEFLDRLDLTDVTVVANDTGGAITQILMADHPERLGRVVLTPCDALDCFFPPMFAPMVVAARIPGSIRVLTTLMRSRAIQRSPLAYGFLSRRGIPNQVLDSYLTPVWRDGLIRRDTRRFLKGVHRRYTLAAAESFPRFDKPVLLVRADGDRVFPASLPERLAAKLPNAKLITVADSYTFVPEDQPAELARLIIDFGRSG